MTDDGAGSPLRAHHIAIELATAWREHARRGLSPDVDGVELARRQSELTDRALATIFDEALSRATKRQSDLALIALGGYGREELCPHSDIDVVLAYDGRVKGLAEIAAAIWYPLWDAGFKVGHSVRSVREAAAAVSGNIEMLTTHLDARFVAGSAAVYKRLTGKVGDIARKRSTWVVEALAEARGDRLRKPLRQWGTLEPDLKQSAGGLRDLQTIRWAGAALVAEGAGGDRLGAMVATGLIAPYEADALERALATVLNARFSLHATDEKTDDRLTLERQPAVAKAIGDASVDDLMKKVQMAMLAISNACGALLDPRTVGAPEPLQVAEPIRDIDSVLTTIATTLDGVGDRRYRTLTVETRQSIHEFAKAASPEAIAESTRPMLAGLLSSGPGVVGALETLETLGGLRVLFPELAHMEGRTQHNPYHRYTVDAHSFHALALTADGDPDSGSPDVASDVRNEIGDDLATYLAILFHDAAKGMPGDHAEVGAELVVSAARRIGLSEPDVARASRVVRHHLLLADFATRRDIADPIVVKEVAARVEDVATLKSLYLLTVADSRATGPAAWSAWKGGLVRALYLAVLREIEGSGTSREEANAERAERLRGRIGDASWAAAELLLDGAPEAFLRAADDETLVDCIRLMESRATGADVAFTHRHRGHGIHEIVIVAADRPSLLNRLAGAVALNSMSILGANLMTLDSGLAVDVLQVTHGYEEEPAERRWQKLESDIGDALTGRMAIAHRLRTRARARRKPAIKTVDPRIVVDNIASAEWTVIEIHARDREGFLYMTTRELADLGLDIHLARIATMGEDVVDVFYVKNLNGEKVVDEKHIGEIRDALADVAANDPW